MSNKTLTERAIAAYLKSGSPDQPGRGSEEVEIDGVRHVVLRNVNGILAVYKLDPKGMLRHLNGVPDGIFIPPVTVQPNAVT